MDGILATFFSAMTPIGELRLAIPLGMHTYELAWYQVYLLAVAGNMIPVVFLLWGLDRFTRLLIRYPNPLGRLILWRAERLRQRQGMAVQRWGALALTPFVAIPLPITGAWTGCLAAWALDIPPRRAVPPILLGVLIAGVIVTALTALAVNFPFIGE